MSQPTSSRASRKASERSEKPYPDFPLSPHPRGQWQRKIRGKIYYFWRWAHRVGEKLVRVDGDGWQAAFAEYKRGADDLRAGRTPREEADKDGLTVAELCDVFLAAKTRMVEAGQLTSMMFYGYKVVARFLVKQFGANRLVDDFAGDDFATLRAAMAKKWGPVRLANSITCIRSVITYCFDNGHT